MRPNSIKWFERLFLATLAIGLFQAGYAWQGETTTSSVPFVLFVTIAVFLIILVLILLVSRKRNRVAMWILVAFFVIGIPAFYKVLTSGQFFGVASISVFQTILELIALIFLFTPTSRAWLSRNEGSKLTEQH
jgi:hypothetical protein